MLTILTTIKQQQQVIESVNTIERLMELITITTDKDSIGSANKSLIIDDSIYTTLDWNDTEPPYLFPKFSYSQNNLLALLFYKLGNHQRAFDFLEKDSALFTHLLIATNLQFGYHITAEQILFLENTSKHNLAIVYNLGELSSTISKQEIQGTYELAIKNEQEDSRILFTVKYYANFLMDNGLNADAEKLIRKVQHKAVSLDEKNTIHHLLASALMGQLTIPYAESTLEEIAHLQEKCIAYYNQYQLPINAGLMLISASEIAGFQKDFAQAKDLIQKAILYFKENDFPDFLGEATLQKATLLYNWSKNGSPQYYKPAINSYQDALKLFKKEVYPQQFADIHHNLALIYSEIKVAENEKPIWTAFCASSFKEALVFYDKNQFPYQYAMVAHNYATALMGFPEAKLHNNLDKAFNLFEEALIIRSAKDYPFERALTLLNQLELYWLIHNENTDEEIKNYEQMIANANEVTQLVTDTGLIEKAKAHIAELEKINISIE